MAKRKHYDLIFIDLVMPKMNGIETCKRLREVSPRSEFVCFTGIFDRVLTARGADYIEAGGRTRLLYKPFRAKAFIETAQQILNVAN
jgi:CheY-like chemotaxis protein